MKRTSVNAGNTVLMMNTYKQGGGMEPIGFHSTMPSYDFQLVSLRVLHTWGNYVITGYNDGVAMVTDTIAADMDDYEGSVTYVRDQQYDFGGFLSFSSGWSKIDSVTFTSAAGGQGMLIILDDVVLRSHSIKLDAFSDSGIVGDNITSYTMPMLTGTAAAGANVMLYEGESSWAKALPAITASGRSPCPKGCPMARTRCVRRSTIRIAAWTNC